MSTLQASNDVAFIKAQITKDDKELREIIKNKTQSSTATAAKPSTARSPSKTRGKTSDWVSAEPQRAVLMDMESGLYPDFHTLSRTSSHGSKQSQVGLYNRASWKHRPSARV